MDHNLKTLANPFQFLNLDVRTAIDEHNQAWFCAKDVCEILDLTWSGATLENMPEACFIMLKLNTIKGERDTNFVNIAGLFRLIMRSNKPNAIEFQNWVCGEVLPEIFRTGSFGQLDIKAEILLDKRIDDLCLQLIATKNAFRHQLLMDRLRRICNIAGQPMPDIKLIALTLEQLDLFDGGVR